ncbi:hypothetical protein U1Q18_047456, partial [Sarracenia purpurea var. burkii]
MSLPPSQAPLCYPLCCSSDDASAVHARTTGDPDDYYSTPVRSYNRHVQPLAPTFDHHRGFDSLRL